MLRVAGAQPLDEALGVAAVHEAVVDGALADAAVESALRALVGRLVDAGHRRAAA